MNTCANCGSPIPAGKRICPSCYPVAASSEWASKGWFSWLNEWGWPFAWILLIPAVTVSWQAVLLHSLANQDNCVLIFRGELGGDEWGCPVGDVLPTLLPGLLNLVAFLWLVFPGRTRHAALIAGTLGALRLGVPVLLYITSGPDMTVVTGGLIWPAVRGDSFLASWVLWFLSLVAAGVFAWAVKGDQLLYRRLLVILASVTGVLVLLIADFPGKEALWTLISLALLALFTRAIVKRMRSRR